MPTSLMVFPLKILNEKTIKAYKAARDALLTQIIETLSADARIAAALHQLYTQMEKLAGQASHLGADVPTSPLPEINILLDLT